MRAVPTRDSRPSWLPSSFLARLVAVLLAWLLAAAPCPAAGDTGTYRIRDYRVLLTPLPDGQVRVDYRQTWLVESGRIPWITIGTANQRYSVLSWGGDASAARASNEGAWSGVRLDLDREYRPGETFTVSLSLRQENLLWRRRTGVHLEFTPGWYDRARIDSLGITLRHFAPLDSVHARPPADRSGERELSWLRADLSAGERFPVAVRYPSSQWVGGAFPRAARRGGPVVPLLIVGGVLVALLALGVPLAIRRGGGRGGYTGGGVYVPGATYHGGAGSSGARGCACACACVACACACACAGGGGAGCARKLAGGAARRPGRAARGTARLSP